MNQKNKITLEKKYSGTPQTSWLVNEPKQNNQCQSSQTNSIDYVWFSESTKKKNTKENNFFMFDCSIENTKEKQI